MKEYAAGKPFVLIECKSDLREVAKQKLAMEIVDEFDGIHMSAAIDSQAFFECSAKTMASLFGIVILLNLLISAKCQTSI